jgi:hypothetical protein
MLPATAWLPERYGSMTHYRIYQLDSDRITSGYSVECGSDNDALRTAGRLLAQHPATAVEVWQGGGA